MRSKAQRRWMWANDPEMAGRWEKETPDGKKLPEKVKHAFFKGAADAYETFGLRTAAKECRLKIRRPTENAFHGVKKVVKDEARKNAGLADGNSPLEAQADADAPVEQLTEILQSLPVPEPPTGSAQEDPLNRETAWGAPTDLSGGDAGSRASDMGQNTGIGTAF
jgi:hypothetical protein